MSYDPGLPILRELEEAVARHAEAAERGLVGGAAARRGRFGRGTTSRTRARRARRVRRVAVLGGLVALVAGTAVATRLVDGGPVPVPRATGEPPPAVVLARAPRDAGERWELRARADARRLCLALEAGATEVQRCVAPPASKRVVLQSAAGAERRYVFGLAGEEVVRVRVDAGGTRRTVRVRRIRAERLLLDAALPPGVGFFVAELPLGRGDVDDVPRARPVGRG